MNISTQKTFNMSQHETLLPEWGLILVEGPDAANLLQNQLTNSVLDLKPMNPGEIALGPQSAKLIGYCNPKGRLMASAWIGLFPEDGGADNRYCLFISRDIASSTAKRLSMYILRSKVTVKDVSDDWGIYGCYGDSPITSSKFIALGLPGMHLHSEPITRTLIAKPKMIEGNSDSSDPKILEQWNSLEVLSAIPRIVLATQEQFVPQMINFESVHGVDFKKGCYPGQEIVARSQYRGAVKRRLHLAHTVLDDFSLAHSQAGVEIFHSSDSNQPAGMVVLASPNPHDPNRIDLQIECKLDMLEHGEIYLGQNNGPVLKMDSLPYPLLEI
jgi:tRNA-modifying protein YgfZ